MDEVIEILKALRAGQEYLVAKVDSIDHRLAKVEGTLIQVDNRLVKVEGTLTQVDNRLAKVEGDVKEIKDGQLRHERLMESLSLRYVELDTEVKDIKRADN